ncbi:MAG: hypothetical protein ACI9MR_004053 [Myxococcota bacterium]|jgi:hypothetical protein
METSAPHPEDATTPSVADTRAGAVATAKPDSGDTTGPSGTKASAALKAGVMTGAVLEAWNGLFAEGDAPPKQSTPFLAMLDKCADATLAGEVWEGCAVGHDPLVVGLRKDGAVALLRSGPQPSCVETASGTNGLIAMLPSLRVGATAILTEPESEEPESDAAVEATALARAKATWGWLKRLPKAGFEPAIDILETGIWVEAGIRMARPSARLRAPLKGWFLDTVPGDKNLAVRLVSPDNQKSTPVGEIAHAANPDCDPEGRKDGVCGEYTLVSLESLVLSLDQTQLIAAYTLSDGSHCGTDLVKHTAWAIPEGVTLTK